MVGSAYPQKCDFYQVAHLHMPYAPQITALKALKFRAAFFMTDY